MNIWTGDHLAKWAERALDAGAGYWYGTCWYRATDDLLARKAKQYPAHYAQARMSAYARDIARGRMVCDCVGLIKGFFWTADGAAGNQYQSNNCPDTSANGMYAICRAGGGLSDLPEQRGALLWKKGHIGIYAGGGMAIEARGFGHGVVKTAVAGRGWTNWGFLPESMLGYPGAAAVGGEPMLRYGARGQAVARMQAMLKAWDAGALPAWGADGIFGAETRAWVRRFQAAMRIGVDGIVGPVTWGKLKEVG
ncbi:MAG: peptidoglycan-binding domain-containing protein [Christensenellales bacterium]|jgi:peptidoglycan hydrolase-like protein with peptidoglycan-binding domain